MLTVGLALCSCGVGGIISPGDGATHVPTDAEIVAVSADDIESVALTPEVELEETERGPFGLYRWVTFKPAEPLLADTDYTVEVTTDGNRVWTLGFTTSSGPGSGAPPAPAVRGLKAAHIPISCGHSCYAGFRDFLEFEVEVDWNEPIAYYEVSTGGSVYPVVATPGRLLLDSNTCATTAAPPLEPGSTICATVAAVSLAGARSTPSRESCVEVADCPVDDCSGDGPSCAESDPGGGTRDGGLSEEPTGGEGGCTHSDGDESSGSAAALVLCLALGLLRPRSKRRELQLRCRGWQRGTRRKP